MGTPLLAFQLNFHARAFALPNFSAQCLEKRFYINKDNRR